MKIALVHDHFAQEGGAEKVLQTLAEIFPTAPIFTLLYDSRHIKNFAGRKLTPSILQKFPFGVSKYQWYMPLMPMAIESHNLQDYDLVISSASSFAKGVITGPGATHICYCHTPTRYLWHYSSQYLAELRLPGWLKKIVDFEVSRIRQWDREAAERVDYFIANSRTTRERIKKYYHRDSAVIYPPVDTAQFFISQNIGDYFLAGGRFIPHKRFDLAILAFNKLNIPLKIFGDGPDEKRLKKIASSNIEFLGRISEEEKARLMSECRAFIHPQEEDFGISAVEAQASGRPVIAFARGGASETVTERISGLFFSEQTWEELADAVLRFLYGGYNFNPQIIKNTAEKFGVERFKREILKFVSSKLLKDAE
ncbi:glycosyltransferase family 4 protein [Candidatus Falkowbacteria bacterium CG10_big_fil_rev_8_21_14_0_10_43_11]|uniref:Glycosyltransferase family 4 protein n=1 Tax=Candidatus Falkowbacteria bacterium CG10_big_fil_rev_8_21_14_0_10_43_11 TaxID=1974568 RepID=A0A2M6WMN6_9BACT|nr:MAG: glycosyltransferase family 4 protein [Candidatus Falkowbacteria bacterium CG10_big_fil_rev_8_21_14_0_10_43_11]